MDYIFYTSLYKEFVFPSLAEYSLFIVIFKEQVPIQKVILIFLN